MKIDIKMCKFMIQSSCLINFIIILTTLSIEEMISKGVFSIFAKNIS